MDAAAAAQEAFEDARFDEARRLSERALADHADDPVATRRLGLLALLKNRLDEAETLLVRARKLDPSSAEAALALAEVDVRRDAFAKAAPLFRAAGREERARQLESFGADVPYSLDAPDSVELPFVVDDPLPVVEAKGADGLALTLLVDTGGGELTLDTETAKRLAVSLYGERQGTFAGGRHAPVGLAAFGGISLGGASVRSLPVAVMNLAPLAGVFGGRHIDGVLGTVVLYHFLSTLDYPKKKLVLRKRDGDAAKALRAETRAPEVPFLLARDHFMLARGAIGAKRDMLWLVDTGLAGGGFSAPEETLAAAGISLDRAHAGVGMGGGGEVEAIPFTVPELSLGPVTAKNVEGIFSGPFPVPKLLGFRVDGLVSHGFLQPYAVTFDFDRMRIRLAR
jgi:predicted aspartyl protease